MSSSFPFPHSLLIGFVTLQPRLQGFEEASFCDSETNGRKSVRDGLGTV